MVVGPLKTEIIQSFNASISESIVNDVVDAVNKSLDKGCNGSRSSLNQAQSFTEMSNVFRAVLAEGFTKEVYSNPIAIVKPKCEISTEQASAWKKLLKFPNSFKVPDGIINYKS
jgi:hypothetical protein